ncbi:MAG: AbfB domain-containing protein, partial [Actinoplanes sp.]
VAAGAAATVANLPEPAPQRPTVIAARPSDPVPPTPRPSSAAPAAPSSRPAATRTTTPATVALTPGRTVSLESADRPGLFVSTTSGLGVLTPATDAAARRQATFATLDGVGNAACFSFRAQDGRYLRHASWRFRLDPDQGTPLFRGDATFCPKPGTPTGAITLEASNYPGWFLHHRGSELWVDQTDGSAAFLAESSFRARPGLTG